MKKIIGRYAECNYLKSCYESESAEFVVVYGRRRVGKTFLVRSFFKDQFHFHVTGLADSNTVSQLYNFNRTLAKKYPVYLKSNFATNWYDAFDQLINYLSLKATKRKVVFFDELPWFDTAKSEFLSAFEHFWNHWASARNDIMLIICGSSASWIIDNVINNKDGLHNRATKKVKLSAFTLSETEEYLISRKIKWTQHQICEAYMAFGGIPFYLNGIRKGVSVPQCIDELFFTSGGLLRNEFNNLYKALFKKPENYIAVVKALSNKMKGLTRAEIITIAKLPNGGGLTKVLTQLEQCDFIRKYNLHGDKKKDALYQLTDFYSLFYFNFIEDLNDLNENLWLTQIGNGERRAWSGYSFELLCMQHVKQIKHALGIAAITTQVSGWRSRLQEKNAQIDLVIDRNDKCINLCEMKFSDNTYKIDKRYAANIQNKIAAFKQETDTKKAVFFTMITTFGVTNNNYYQQWVSNQVELSKLYAF